MTQRSSTTYLGLTALLMLTLAGLLLHSGRAVQAAQDAFARKRALVRRVQLTDICLFTEANYTRNPSMTDLATPFQDAPVSLDHFPSGALMAPPLHLTGRQRD